MPEKKEIILLVEDNQDHIKMATAILENMGYKVLQAENGRMGIQTAKSKKPHLILMDLEMPIMDGFEAIAELKRQEETKNIPIIALTVYNDLSNREKCEQLGCTAFLEKPLTPYFVDMEIKKVLGQIKSKYWP